MRSFASNLAFVRASLDEWPDYERSETLFWPLSARAPVGSPPFLHMTIGNLLLALDEMRAVEPSLSPNDRFALRRADMEWESRWTGRSVRLEQKTRREVASRIRQWQAYVHDVLESREASDYAQHIRPRLCAVRLIEALDPKPEAASPDLAELEISDRLLDRWLEDGPCLLGEAMASAYPLSPHYRFLYRQPVRAAGQG